VSENENENVIMWSIAEKQSTLDRIAKLEEEVKKLKNVIGSD
jgi:hypothetical protein